MIIIQAYQESKRRMNKSSCTVANAEWFEGSTGLNCVGGVNEVQRSAEDPRQNIGQLLPCAIHARRAEKSFGNV